MPQSVNEKTCFKQLLISLNPGSKYPQHQQYLSSGKSCTKDNSKLNSCGSHNYWRSSRFKGIADCSWPWRSPISIQFWIKLLFGFQSKREGYSNRKIRKAVGTKLNTKN